MSDKLAQNQRERLEQALEAPFKEWINSDYRWEQYPSSSEAWRAYLAGAIAVYEADAERGAAPAPPRANRNGIMGLVGHPEVKGTCDYGHSGEHPQYDVCINWQPTLCVVCERSYEAAPPRPQEWPLQLIEDALFLAQAIDANKERAKEMLVLGERIHGMILRTQKLVRKSKHSGEVPAQGNRGKEQ